MTEHVLAQPPSLVSTLWHAWSTRHKRPGPVHALEPVTWSMPRVTVQAERVSQYLDVCGFDAAHGVPFTYPQLLTFPLVMAYLSSPDCPWPAVGTVHLANAIEQREPLHVGDDVSVELHTAGLRAHDKGQVFDLELRVLRDGEWVWRGTQTLLRRGVRHPAGPLYASAIEDVADMQRCAEFEARSTVGRRYASVSGDYNPMHWSTLGARLLGFRRMIAHGLWTQARALACLQPHQPWRQARLLTEFRSPLLLPVRASVWQDRQNASWRFDVRDVRGDRLHVRALLTDTSA
jgi:MaoC like domain